mmetsp:Transcript_19431/g.61116  ORF Transcript_19431/g.61116 Transcript_19431/m.61116 type:complete len:559 (-) Transcript_19431:70-1746(-)
MTATWKAGAEDRAPEARSKWFLRYVLFVAVLAFTGRAAPLSFLPLVLKDTFQQPGGVIGIVMATYPFSALVTTPWAARRARRTRRIVSLHSWAIICVAVAMLLTSFAEYIQSVMGSATAVVWVMCCRCLQGVGASLYLSSNTVLITRSFSATLPYVIAMTEVAVGSGGQLGRLCGGFLYDLGGFACPFVVIACFQGLTGLVGFAFETESSSSESPRESEEDEPTPKHWKSEAMPWRALATPRLCMGASGAFMQFFLGCWGDATLLQYLVVHLAPISVTTLSMVMSTRGFTYLVTSLLLAQLMHGELVSFERLLSCGYFLAIWGQIIMGPQPFIASLEAGRGLAPSGFSVWATEIGSMVTVSVGAALMFVPSLPLMQSEVRHHGEHAVEQVAELFVTMMTLGEMLGPIFGGWVVGQIGFVHGTVMLACLCTFFFVLSLCVYDGEVARARQIRHRAHLTAALADTEDQPEDAICGKSCGPRCVVVPSDGEASFAWRRIPFALDVKRNQSLAPSSAPSSVFRRKYSPAAVETQKHMTAPMHSRREYVPARGGQAGSTGPNR